MKYIATLNTNGSGLWSRDSQTVNITKIFLIYYRAEDQWHAMGELRVYFDKSCWDVTSRGYIYTDNLWIKQFRELLKAIGYSANAAKSVDYSEQGMQGSDYVSLDVGREFLEEHFNDVLRFLNGKTVQDNPVETISL